MIKHIFSRQTPRQLSNYNINHNLNQINFNINSSIQDIRVLQSGEQQLNRDLEHVGKISHIKPSMPAM